MSAAREWIIRGDACERVTAERISPPLEPEGIVVVVPKSTHDERDREIASLMASIRVMDNERAALRTRAERAEALLTLIRDRPFPERNPDGVEPRVKRPAAAINRRANPEAADDFLSGYRECPECHSRGVGRVCYHFDVEGRRQVVTVPAGPGHGQGGGER